MPTRLDYTALGHRIRQNRRVLHLTQTELAEQVGISLSFLGHIERGTRKASIETLVGIAAALNVSVDSLLVDTYIPSYAAGNPARALAAALLSRIVKLSHEAADVLAGLCAPEKGDEGRVLPGTETQVTIFIDKSQRDQ